MREFKGIEEEKLAGFALDTKNPQVYKPGGSVFSSIRARHDLWTCCGRGLLVSVICDVLLLLLEEEEKRSILYILVWWSASTTHFLPPVGFPGQVSSSDGHKTLGRGSVKGRPRQQQPQSGDGRNVLKVWYAGRLDCVVVVVSCSYRKKKKSWTTSPPSLLKALVHSCRKSNKGARKKTWKRSYRSQRDRERGKLFWATTGQCIRVQVSDATLSMNSGGCCS